MATRSVDIGIRADPSHAIAGFAQAGAAAGAFQNTVQSIGTSVTNLGKTVGVFTAVAAAGVVAATKQAIGFESQVGDAGRALNLTSKELEDFRKLALETAPPLGLLPSTFAEFATEAGKLGVAKEDIKDFSLLVAQTNAATDAGAVSIAQNFAAIKAIFHTNNDELRNYAATLNALDDQVGGSFATISDFVSRVGATGKLVGLENSTKKMIQ
ncbi:MAG: phage tail tape measure protein [Brasilonema sp.]